MNIIMKSATDSLTAVEMYKMVKSPEVRKVSDADGMTLKLDAYVLYDDEKVDPKTGEIIHQEVLSIMSEGTAYATNSPTFIRDFKDMMTMFSEFGDDVHSVKVQSSKSRAGRTFYNCIYND